MSHLPYQSLPRFQLRRCPSGFSLVEMVVVLSVAAALMAVNVGWMHQSLKFADKLKRRQQQHQSLTRLAWSLRDDVGNSNSMSLVGDRQLVLRQTDETIITYSILPDAVAVDYQKDDAIIKRERFRIPVASIIRWDNSELPDWISLIIRRKTTKSSVSHHRPDEHPSPSDAGPIELHVRTSLKRWNRHLERHAP